jgi:hypothetical protein
MFFGVTSRMPPCNNELTVFGLPLSSEGFLRVQFGGFGPGHDPPIATVVSALQFFAAPARFKAK